MQTQIVKVDPRAPEPEVIARAAEVILSGGLVAFPTETVYGLGASALNPDAVARIFAAKERPARNPLIVHTADCEEAQRYVTAWNEKASRLAQEFWPGPLSMVLPKSNAIPEIVTASQPTVAVRVPAHPVAHSLIVAAGYPIAAPSANLSTQVSPTSAQHVLKSLEGRIELILDGGQTPRGLESTVIDLTSDPPGLLRPGPIPPAAIERVIGPLRRVRAFSVSGPLRSPGMMNRHYAPRTVMECLEYGYLERVSALKREGMKVGLLALERPGQEADSDITIVMPSDPETYAAHIYAHLHALDAAEVDRIVVALPPEEDRWLAVRDRLLRASAQE